jgi:uncharacterized protein YndB with AHSA1/START domain
MSMSRVAAGLDVAIVIDAPPGRVLKAFFEHEALNAWWQVARSVTTPRILGPYAIEWAPTDFRDPVLGRLGGVFRGTVMQFQEGRGFFVADAFWLPPDGDPIGPMSLEVTCALFETSGDVRFRPGSVATQVHVTQSGFEESVRWRRYYEVVNDGWERALESLKSLLEH